MTVSAMWIRRAVAAAGLPIKEYIPASTNGDAELVLEDGRRIQIHKGQAVATIIRVFVPTVMSVSECYVDEDELTRALLRGEPRRTR
jgi:hypothetical protein